MSATTYRASGHTWRPRRGERPIHSAACPCWGAPVFVGGPPGEGIAVPGWLARWMERVR